MENKKEDICCSHYKPTQHGIAIELFQNVISKFVKSLIMVDIMPSLMTSLKKNAIIGQIVSLRTPYK